ncbi:uncharacterized protein LOC143299850 [Babylonia areolata]|uniref:uncharacterized protein LOC143299850 n=1 Tax=Babylonia areolata TaxID=304850 RepID=UPI003FD6303A
MTGGETSSPGPMRARCPVNSLPCRNSTSCYRKLWACDGIRDCPLADDELGCYHSSNKTVEKETNSGGGDNPYSLELGFLIFVMAGGLLFLLFLWWLCNISVHRRGHRGVGCMEALVADLKDRTWKSDLYPEDFSSGDNVTRSLRREVTMEEGHHHHPHHHQSCSFFRHHHRGSSRQTGVFSSSRCSEAGQDEFHSMVIDEVGVFGSPQFRPPCRPHGLNISRPPSYNSCLNASEPGTTTTTTTAPVVIISPMRRSANIIGDDDLDEADLKPGRRSRGGVLEEEEEEEDSASDMLPSYDEVTRDATGLGACHPEGLPKYPPAYREAVE